MNLFEAPAAGEGLSFVDTSLVGRSVDFDVTIDDASDRSLVSLWGELDLASAPLLAERLLPLSGGCLDIHVDLRHLTFIDCAGIQALLDLARTLGGSRQVVLRSVTPSTMRIFDILHLGEDLRIMP